MDPATEERLDEAFPLLHPDDQQPREHFVTVLVVSHEGQQWLPDTLAGLLGQTRAPDLVLAAATTADDQDGALLKVAFGRVATVPASTGLPGVLARMAEEAPVLASDDPAEDADEARDDQVSWIWVLHDDSAPDPDCLAELLVSADRFPQAGILVPKALTWAGNGVLADVGRMWVPGAPEVSLVDTWEHDQGQHDLEREVFTGDSAGLLIRADLWHWLGGPDPDAGPAWAADLCRRTWGCGWEVWFVPDAAIRHRRAGHHGVRPGTSLRSARGAARYAQLYLELTQAPGAALPWRYLRALLTTLGRFAGLALTRELDEALGEFDGAWSVLAHPGRIRRGRLRARAEPVETLERPPGLRLARGRVLRSWVEEMLAAPGSSPKLRRPGLALWTPLAVAAVLVVVALIRGTSTLFGAGSLQGGGLLPADRFGEAMAGYLAGWHEVATGSPLPMPGYVLVLALASLGSAGSLDLLLRLLTTFYVPLAFTSAYLAIGAGGPDRRWPRALRALLALCYAVLPAGLAAAAAGRLTTLVLGLLGPWAVHAVARALHPGPDRWLRRAIWAGLVLGATAAFAPLTWWAGLLWCAGILIPAAGRAVRLRCATVLQFVASLVVVWTLPGWVARPWSMLFDVGVNSQGLLGADLPKWFAVGLAPGGPGSAAPAAGLALSAAALIAVMTRPSRAGLGWLALWAGGAAAATLVAGVQFPQLSSGAQLAAWPGQFLLVAGAGAIMACAASLRPPARVTAMAHAPQRLAPVLGLAALVAVAGLLLLSFSWSAPPGPAKVSAAAPLPAVAAADGVGPERTRSLVVGRDSAGVLGYYLANGEYSELGDADVAIADPQQALLDDTVSQLVSGSGGAMSGVLADRAVAYIVFTGSGSDPVVAALDATPGLRRLAGISDQALWLVIQSAPRAALVAASGDSVTVPVTTVPTSVDVVLHPQMSLPRQLRLAERADPGWHVEVSGQPTASADAPFVRAEVAATGPLQVQYDSIRRWLVALQLGLLTLVVLLALPKRRPVDQSQLDPDSVPGTSPDRDLR